jgi:uncharacterized membrane protein
MSAAATTVVAGFVIPSASPWFLAGVAAHVAAGLAAVVAGAVAMLSRKGRGRHSDAGSVYYGALAVVFASAVMLALVRWAQDYPLFLLAVASFGAASFGRAAMRRRWPAAARLHITGMGLSYILLLTAFYVDNGPQLPVWKDLPPIAYWTVPAAVGLPILLLALWRHPLVRRGGLTFLSSGPVGSRPS